MLPKHLRYEPEPEFNTGHRTGGGTSSETVAGHNEDSNGSNNNSNEKVSILAPLRWHLPSKLLEKVKIKKKMTIWLQILINVIIKLKIANYRITLASKHLNNQKSTSGKNLSLVRQRVSLVLDVFNVVEKYNLMYICTHV